LNQQSDLNLEQITDLTMENQRIRA